MIRAALIMSIIVLVAPEVQHFPKNVIFVVDTSGSMDGDKITEAMEAFRLFAGQPTDEMRMKVIAFQTNSVWWKSEWTKLPDANAIQEAAAWLKGVQLSGELGGGTSPIPSLRDALKDPEPELAVVLISDGQFSIPPLALAILKSLAKERVVGTVMIGADEPGHMGTIGKWGLGGCYRMETK